MLEAKLAPESEGSYVPHWSLQFILWPVRCPDGFVLVVGVEEEDMTSSEF